MTSDWIAIVCTELALLPLFLSLLPLVSQFAAVIASV
jgi:hypothetical protein